MQAKVDKFGRVLIPKFVRQKLGLKPGEKVELEESDQEIIIRAKAKNKRKVGSDKGLVQISEDFDAPLDEFREYMG